MNRPLFIFVSLTIATAAVFAVTQRDVWLTGRMQRDELDLIRAGPTVNMSSRVWIDTDAACGATPRTDPDDCFAIAWLVSRDVDIVGISTSFGNATSNVVESTVKSLVATMTETGMPPIPIWKGLAEPVSPNEVATEPSVIALRAALEAGPLTILSLGPLTNLFAALDGRPDLKRHVSRVIAVMGHRPGHLFHPAEGRGIGALLRHGPIFRDLNFSVDQDAATQLFAMKLPLTLIPYDAAHRILITGPDLEKLGRRGRALGWIAERAKGWLAFWNEDMGLPGFYPFDWIAAAYLVNPQLFDCVQTKAQVAREWMFWIIPRRSLVVDPTASGETANDVLYCPQTASTTHDFLISNAAK